MKYKVLIILVVAVIVGAIVLMINPSLLPTGPTQPNIVLISIDTLRADHLS